MRIFGVCLYHKVRYFPVPSRPRALGLIWNKTWRQVAHQTFHRNVSRSWRAWGHPWSGWFCHRRDHIISRQYIWWHHWMWFVMTWSQVSVTTTTNYICNIIRSPYSKLFLGEMGSSQPTRSTLGHPYHRMTTRRSFICCFEIHIQ